MKILFANLRHYIISLLLIAISLYLSVALTFYNSNDPSFNRATGTIVKNITGKYGAYFADPLLQMFGLTNIVIILIIISYGIELFINKKITYFYLKLITFFICVVSFSGFLAEISSPEWWNFISLGGYLGYFLKKYFNQFFPSNISFAMLFFVSISSFLYSTNISYKYLVNVFHFIIRLNIYIIHLIKYNIVSIRNKKQSELLENVGLEIIEPDPEIEKIEEITFPTNPILPKFNIIKKDRSTQTIIKKLSHKDNIFKLPSLTLLSGIVEKSKKNISENNYIELSTNLEKILGDFGVSGKIVAISPGPVVTLYELEPAAGVKSSRVIGLADDIARSMSALSTRIAVVSGRNAIGIELPNINREIVYLREILESKEYKDQNLRLPIILGKDIGGASVVVDLSKMPHLLVAGTTGSGKSVAINTMILSLLYRLTPEECKFIMIDPKMLELSVYDGIPHLLSPVVTEPSKAIVALKWTVKEMENRYRLMSNLAVRNILGYNKKILEAVENGEILERTVQTGFESATGKPIYEKIAIEMKPLPYIVVVVDEMADLMLVAGKDIESSIQRLAQMARAAGIHIIMATQRPSVDVITGVIKANFPTRISFQVTSRIDSRTILGEQGAEQLLGMGDMLYMAGGSRISRVHGPFVDDKEVEKIVNYLKIQCSPEYIDDITKADENSSPNNSSGSEEEGGDNDLYNQAVQIILRDKKVSTSYIQRCLRIGYNRAAIIIEKMEIEGIISKANHVGKREILINE